MPDIGGPSCFQSLVTVPTESDPPREERTSPKAWPIAHGRRRPRARDPSPLGSLLFPTTAREPKRQCWTGEDRSQTQGCHDHASAHSQDFGNSASINLAIFSRGRCAEGPFCSWFIPAARRALWPSTCLIGCQKQQDDSCTLHRTVAYGSALPFYCDEEPPCRARNMASTQTSISQRKKDAIFGLSFVVQRDCTVNFDRPTMTMGRKELQITVWTLLNYQGAACADSQRSAWFSVE